MRGIWSKARSAPSRNYAGQPAGKHRSNLYPATALERMVDNPEETAARASDPSKIFRKDLERITRSFAFRRLANKTQMFPIGQNDYVRNRLTHSLEVASVGKGLATRFNENSPELFDDPINMDLIEIAAFVHDIGHPPFGHTGEDALNACMAQWGGFEGNAQSLRLITTLEACEDEPTRSGSTDVRSLNNRPALNLTFRSVAASIKYDNEIKQNRTSSSKPQKGYYPLEADIVRLCRTKCFGSKSSAHEFPLLECQIMDVADDIAYVVFDLDDSFKTRYLDPIKLLAIDKGMAEHIASLVSERTNRQVSAGDVETFVGSIFSDAVLNYDKSHSRSDVMLFRENEAFISSTHRRTKFSKGLIDFFASGVSLRFNQSAPAGSQVVMEEEKMLMLETLKAFVYESVISSPEIRTIQHKMVYVVRSIFDALMSETGIDIIPRKRQKIIHAQENDSDKARTVCDYIADMTDTYAMEIMERQKSVGGDTIYKPVY